MRSESRASNRFDNANFKPIFVQFPNKKSNSLNIKEVYTREIKTKLTSPNNFLIRVNIELKLYLLDERSTFYTSILW